MEVSDQQIHVQPRGATQQPRLEEIAEEPRENATNTAMKRQLALDNPEAVREEVKETAMNNDEMEIKTNRRKKMIVGGVAIFLILAVIVATAVCLTVYLTKSKQNTAKARMVVKKRNQLALGKRAKINAQTLALSDAQLFADGEELQIYVNEVQSINSVSDGGRLLQETTSSSAVLEVHDPYTDITLSLNSDRFQADVGVSLSSILMYVLNNQPSPDIPQSTESNLKVDGEEVLMAAGTEETQVQTLTYYTINGKLETAISEALVESGATNLRASLENSYDGTITTDGLMEIGQQEGLQSTDPESPEPNGVLTRKSPRLVKPSTNVTLNDVYNETEIAIVAARVVRDVVSILKQVLRKNLELIKKEAAVSLKSVDPTDGETSLYLDDPSDVLKDCDQLSSGGLRCTESILQSGLFELSNQMVNAVPLLNMQLNL